jgi:hypothetical protein
MTTLKIIGCIVAVAWMMYWIAKAPAECKGCDIRSKDGAACVCCELGL